MIRYVPIEKVAVEGRDLFYQFCIWVHGQAQGRGNFQKRGMGKALLAAAEEDVQRLGAKGFVVWGFPCPSSCAPPGSASRAIAGWTGMECRSCSGSLSARMPHRRAGSNGRRSPSAEPGKIVITCFKNGWCPAMNMTYERASRAAAELGPPVVFREIDSFRREVAAEWGISDALFVDGRQIRTGPPPSYEKIRKAIVRRIAALRR